MAPRKFKVVLAAMMVAALACAALLAGCGQSSSSASASGSASKSASASSASSSSSKSSSSSSSKSSTSSTASSSSSSTGKKATAEGPYATGTHHAVLTVEGYEPITIELDADAAPASVANFCKLANDGYYNGLTFYRFVDGFCMQGGTKGNNASGQDATLENVVGEFSSNGYDNDLADNFKKGTVAMARSSDPDSASSTFFVTLGSDSSVKQALNGLYAAFGTIDSAGMEIVDQIVADYLPKVTEPTMGAIEDEADQAKIVSIEITD